ncbi:MAG: 23S rRNA (uracil(1939)-C(5))-methyltransferase RlmD, partial [Burkholderiaceae bacterium]
EGRGVAHREGKVVFVEGALPGEIVRYERIRNKPSYETGRALQIDRESWMRVTPGCENFGLHEGACGGCAMQHVDARAQVAIKQRVLEDALWHIGKLRADTVLTPIYGPTWGYRHRARLTVRDVLKKGTVLVGFHERSSSYVADMTSCKVLPPHVSALLVPLRELIAQLSIRQRMPQIELAVAGEENRTALVFRVLEPPSAEDCALLDAFAQHHRVDIWLQPKGPDTAAPMDPAAIDALRLRLPEFRVELPFKPTDFTQVNHRINEVLVSRALRLLEIEPGDRVADFFCGLGNFTLPIATRAKQVVGIEGSEVLVQRARDAAQLNGLADKTRFVARNLFDWTQADWESLWTEVGGIDRVLIDPPREGALELVRSLALTANRPKRVVYVSCNPATLARDCAVLKHEGGWQVKAAGVVNMFPHTAHVESIAVLEPGA